MRLAVAQAPAALDTPADRLDWLADTLPQAVARGADLLLLPELFACGYNIGEAVHDRAEPLEGPTRDRITALARAHGLAIHYGFAERSGDRLYNAAACVAPDGTLLCHQRKLTIPPGPERQYFQPGTGTALFDFKGFCVATLICYDAEFPEWVRHVALQGATLVLVPTALGAQWGWVARSMIPVRAYENGLYLAYANSCGHENGMDFLGASVVAAPGGREATRGGADPVVLLADLDPAAVAGARARLPYLADRPCL